MEGEDLTCNESSEDGVQMESCMLDVLLDLTAAVLNG